MRHSDINLTMRAYTHIMLEDKQQAIAALPEIKPLLNGDIATGTYDIEIVSDNSNLKGGEKLPISTHNGKICLDCSGQSVNNKEDSEISVSTYYKRKNTAKSSVYIDSNTNDLFDTDWSGRGESNPCPNNDNPFINRELQGNPKCQVAKNCLNDVQKVQNNDIDTTGNNQVAEAVLAINSLPLSDQEKAQMIRLLMMKN